MCCLVRNNSAVTTIHFYDGTVNITKLNYSQRAGKRRGMGYYAKRRENKIMRHTLMEKIIISGRKETESSY